MTAAIALGGLLSLILVGLPIAGAWAPWHCVPTSWTLRVASLPDILLPGAIFAIVIGSIYGGFATPTEAAAIGVVTALALALAKGALSLDMLRAAIEGTFRTTGMIMLIVLSAGFLNFVLAALEVVAQIESLVTGINASPAMMLAFVIAIYLVLGCLIEVLSLLLITAPILAPIVIGLGYDPVWFGILLMVLLEAALITPPVGLNLFVVQGLRPQGSMNDVMVGSLPFVISLFVMIALLIAFSSLALWLPSVLE